MPPLRAVRKWLDGVLEQVELQARIDEAKAERELRDHEMHVATVLACAEADKKRVRPFGPERDAELSLAAVILRCARSECERVGDCI